MKPLEGPEVPQECSRPDFYNCHIFFFSIIRNFFILLLKISENNDSAVIKTNNFEIKSNKVLIATNGFASQLINQKVAPARAQVLITKPIKNLHIKGTFHLDKGYYYFRNIEDRILFGGGRNLDFKGEETTEFGQTELIQEKLEDLLRTTIIPNIDFEIELFLLLSS